MAKQLANFLSGWFLENRPLLLIPSHAHDHIMSSVPCQKGHPESTNLYSMWSKDRSGSHYCRRSGSRAVKCQLELHSAAQQVQALDLEERCGWAMQLRQSSKCCKLGHPLWGSPLFGNPVSFVLSPPKWTITGLLGISVYNIASRLLTSFGIGGWTLQDWIVVKQKSTWQITSNYIT